MAPSPPGAALRHKDRPVCIEFPLDCSVIVAVTEQRHRGALSPASSLKGPEQFPPPLPSTNPAVMSSTVSFALSVCPSARPGFFFALLHRVARMREKEMMTERVVWPTPNTRASSGAMSFPATRYTPATAAPEGGENTHRRR